MKRIHTLALAASAAALAGACGGGGGSPPATGTLSVSLTDNPCDHRAVHVTIDRLRVHASADAAEGDAGWRDLELSLPADRRRVDLLTLQNGVLLPLGDVALGAGRYTQLRLVLAQNGSGPPWANELTLADGTRVPLATPSAQRSGVKLIHPFEVAPDQVVELTLDFDACRSIVASGNAGRYSLKPTIAVVPMLDVGRITGYARQGALVSAQIADGAAAPVVVKSTLAAADGRFDLSPLPVPPDGARYTVVVAAADRATAVIRAVPVAAQQATALSTLASPIPAVTSLASALSGAVSPAGLEGARARALQVVDGVRVEVAAVNAVASTGAFALRVPREAARVATYPAAAPVTPAPSLTFSAAAAPAARYTVEATADGRTPAESAVLDASSGDVVLPQPLTPTP
jgi:hypothetical protein